MTYCTLDTDSIITQCIYLEELVNFGNINTFLLIQFCNLGHIAIHEKQTKASYLWRKHCLVSNCRSDDDAGFMTLLSSILAKEYQLFESRK